ncbi:ribbon-helix-helix protein, CopG family, partial [Escherichia coli]|uniref:ribbon-helix-helix protein, CopG family n=1 Tax=Escherichia coli TaxID=562 RepID=UPI001F0EA51F
MIAVSLPDELLKRLDDAVDKTGKKRSFLIRESISMYLNNIKNIHEKKEIILNTSKPGTVAKLAMRQPFVLFKGLTFQKLCLPGAFR